MYQVNDTLFTHFPDSDTHATIVAVKMTPKKAIKTVASMTKFNESDLIVSKGKHGHKYVQTPTGEHVGSLLNKYADRALWIFDRYTK